MRGLHITISLIVLRKDLIILVNNNVVKLYKVGKFYNAYKDDGYIIHELMGYKYIEYKQSVGFPDSAFSKQYKG